jgi:hypothetical protein
MKYFAENNVKPKKNKVQNSWDTYNFRIYISNINTYTLLSFMESEISVPFMKMCVGKIVPIFCLCFVLSENGQVGVKCPNES